LGIAMAAMGADSDPLAGPRAAILRGPFSGGWAESGAVSAVAVFLKASESLGMEGRDMLYRRRRVFCSLSSFLLLLLPQHDYISRER
jgi:hypothetical protein